MLAGAFFELNCKRRMPTEPDRYRSLREEVINQPHVKYSGYCILMLPHGRYEEASVEDLSVGTVLTLWLEDRPYRYRVYRLEEDAPSVGRYVGRTEIVTYAWARALR